MLHCTESCVYFDMNLLNDHVCFGATGEYSLPSRYLVFSGRGIYQTINYYSEYNLRFSCSFILLSFGPRTRGKRRTSPGPQDRVLQLRAGSIYKVPWLRMDQKMKFWKLHLRLWSLTHGEWLKSRKRFRESRESCVQDFGHCSNLWNRRRIRIQQKKQNTHPKRYQEIWIVTDLLWWFDIKVSNWTGWWVWQFSVNTDRCSLVCSLCWLGFV